MNDERPATASRLPPRQQNLRVATDKALEALTSQPAEQLSWLGAMGSAVTWQLSVLDDLFDIDISTGSVQSRDGREVGPRWRLLVLHYLSVTTRPERRRPEITFGNLPGGRAYAGVYQRRVIDRLCATAGRDARTLRTAAEALAGRAASGGNMAFDFDVFARLTVRLIWYGPDEEFAPSATLLLPDNIESFLCLEDIVVVSECFVSRLAGKPF